MFKDKMCLFKGGRVLGRPDCANSFCNKFIYISFKRLLLKKKNKQQNLIELTGIKD